ncbi:hypothetical protein [Streptomyces broussonetiae]|uniref:Uncharacterized protein n=1 Tax=Streptomyces broussonetiae TaxID=2686304 RepID=A0ABV5EAS7_9ACTN
MEALARGATRVRGGLGDPGVLHTAAGVCVIPPSTDRFCTRPDVIPLRVRDTGPREVAPAWAATRRSRPVQDAARAAQDTLADARGAPAQGIPRAAMSSAASGGLTFQPGTEEVFRCAA